MKFTADKIMVCDVSDNAVKCDEPESYKVCYDHIDGLGDKSCSYEKTEERAFYEMKINLMGKLYAKGNIWVLSQDGKYRFAGDYDLKYNDDTHRWDLVKL
jgi:hypothetical protein